MPRRLALRNERSYGPQLHSPFGDIVNNYSILHLFRWDKKFVLPFRKLIHENFSDDVHNFIIYENLKQEVIPYSSDTVIYSSLLKNVFAIFNAFHSADKIFIHGLFSINILYILLIQPWSLKKCYWVMWGGDLYAHEVKNKSWHSRKKEFIKRVLIKRFGNFVNYVDGDYELAKKWYCANGKLHKCFMYPSNIYYDRKIEFKIGNEINLLVGNSADRSNNHLDIFYKLLMYKNYNIKIFCPLSYGDKDYAEIISKKGTELFGEKFVALINFMPFDKYISMLKNIDIAFFAHKRQQAFGNTISLLGLGKKVYIRRDVTQWIIFNDIGVKVFDVSNIDLLPLDDDIRENNRKKIKLYFSKEVLIKQLHDIFYGK